MVLFRLLPLGLTAWFVAVHGWRGNSVDPVLDPVCRSIWNSDSSRFRLGTDLRVNKQGKARYHGNYDNAKGPLFTNVSAAKLRQPTFKTFIALLDNYIRDTGKTERLTYEEKKENNAFLTAILKTAPMRAAHRFLVQKKKAPTKLSQFQSQLYKMWFYFYKRGAYRDSSGFEHVFCGETRGRTVTGFHNWVQMYLLERKGVLDYKGYFRFYSSEPVALLSKFNWDQYVKPRGGMFLGTSPEVELSLYTVCFFMRPGSTCSCRLGSRAVKIQTHRQRGTGFIGSAYPKV